MCPGLLYSCVGFDNHEVSSREATKNAKKPSGIPSRASRLRGEFSLGEDRRKFAVAARTANLPQFSRKYLPIGEDWRIFAVDKLFSGFDLPPVIQLSQTIIPAEAP
jgi:hypothetical protein